MEDIIYPLVPTYFVAWEGDVISYGINEPTQCTTTGLANLETFTDKTTYFTRLLTFGIDLATKDDDVTSL